jgi:PEP-CTERM motif-containing protein
VQVIKPFLFAIFFGIAAAGLGATAAPAALIEQNLNAPGDKLITFDDVSGLEWLDLTATLSFSYNQVLATSFVTTQGFKFADTAQVSALYTNAGVTDQTGVFVASNFLGAEELLLKLGCTGNCAAPNPFQQGYADLLPASAATAAVPFVQTKSDSTAQALAVLSGTQIKTITLNDIGSYLYRPQAVPDPDPTSIPEPSVLLIFGLGLVGLAGFGWRRRQV